MCVCGGGGGPTCRYASPPLLTSLKPVLDKFIITHRGRESCKLLRDQNGHIYNKWLLFLKMETMICFIN